MSNNFEIQSDEILGKIYDKRLYSRLVIFLKPYIKWVVLAITLLMIIAALELILPLLTKNVVDNHIVSDKRILTLNSSDYQHFKQINPIEKFEVYYANNLHYIVITSKNSKFIPNSEIKSYSNQGLLSKEKFVFIPFDENKKAILNKHTKDIIILNSNLAAIPSKVLTKFPMKERSILRDHSLKIVLYYGLAYLIIVFLKTFIQYYQLVITTVISQKAMNNLRSKLFAHLQRMPVSFFDKNPVGRLVTRVTNDVRSLDEMLSSGVITIFQDAVMVLAIMILMLFLNWRLALISFTILPLVFWVIKIYKDKTRSTYREVRKKLASVNAMLSEHISGMKIIQLFNQSYKKQKEFESINFSYYKESIRQLKLFAIFRPIISVSRQLAIALLLWYAGGQIIENIVTIGVFMAFMSYLERLYEPINDFSEKFNILQGAMAGAERIFDLMDQPEADYQENKLAVNNVSGDIEFKNVWLTYTNPEADNHENSEFVLKNISFKVKAGEKIALVGHTGSGKTSIVNLVLGMYPYQKGDILIDGLPLSDYKLSDLRNHIGMVQQDVFLFSGTIRENIALNNPNLTDADLEKICKYVNVMPFINSLNGKFEEPVMERGSTFSVGQRQLISFARVLAYNPSIFILDEATANIDTETELLIQDALQKLMENRTSIIVAHRLSTIQHVDRILVLHKGEIVEEGSHQELLQKEGLYYDLYRLQYT